MCLPRLPQVLVLSHLGAPHRHIAPSPEKLGCCVLCLMGSPLAVCAATRSYIPVLARLHLKAPSPAQHTQSLCPHLTASRRSSGLLTCGLHGRTEQPSHSMALQAICAHSPAGHQARNAAALLCHVPKCVLPLAHAHLPSRRLWQLRRGQQVCLLQVLQAALPRCTGGDKGLRAWHVLTAQHGSFHSVKRLQKRACMLQQAEFLV